MPILEFTDYEGHPVALVTAHITGISTDKMQCSGYEEAYNYDVLVHAGGQSAMLYYGDDKDEAMNVYQDATRRLREALTPRTLPTVLNDGSLLITECSDG